jgi:hypothetical protein
VSTKKRINKAWLAIALVLGLVFGAALIEYRLQAQESKGTHCNNFAKTKDADKCSKCRKANWEDCENEPPKTPDTSCKRHCSESLCSCIGKCET